MKEQNIEQLFKDGLSNLEADVNPKVWTNVQQGLHMSPPSGHVPGSTSTVVKSAGLLSKMGITNVMIYTAASVLMIGTAIYFVSKKPVADPVVTTAPANPTTDHSIVLPEKTEAQTTTSQVVKESALPPEKNKIKSVVHPVPVEVKQADRPGEDRTRNELVKNITSQNHPIASSETAPVKRNAPSPQNVSQDNSSQKESADLTAPEPQTDPGYQNAATDPKFDQIENYLVSENGTAKSIPNVFTPNGDGINDRFTIRTKNLKTLEVIIYDQSGKTIYAWKSLDGEWDGKLANGADAPSGYYRYSLNAETLDGKICIAGNLLLLKRD